MKKLLAAISILIVMLFTSCDLMMEYEKPDLYLITIGLSYNQDTPGISGSSVLPNTQKDADTMVELFTGLADQAGMDWHSVSYRDVYPSKFSRNGKAVFTLKSSTFTDPSDKEETSISFRDLAYVPTPKSTVITSITELMSGHGVDAPSDKDIIVFYYAGHGIPETGHLWVVPGCFPGLDVGTENPEAVFTQYDLFAGDGLIQRFSGKKVVILDSCYSGTVIRGKDSINGNGGPNGNSDNPYFDCGRSIISGGGSVITPEFGYESDTDNDVPEKKPESQIGAKVIRKGPKPEAYILTSANYNQKASDGSATAAQGPFVSSIIDAIQPGWQRGDEIRCSEKRIMLSDIYKVVSKAFSHDDNQDPQTLLTRYDIVLFDFTR